MGDVVPPLFAYRDRVLHVAGQPLASLVEETGTPVFVVSEAHVLANYRAVVRGLSAEGPAVVRYCAKTNNEGGVLQLLAAAGSEVLVSHPAEAQLAIQAGFAADRIAYQRPVLLAEDVEAVLGMGIRFFHAYRPSDLELIERAAAARRAPVRVSLRLRAAPRWGGLAPLAFLSARLGMSETEIVGVAARHRESQWMKIAAINFYVGTQQRTVGGYDGMLRRVGVLGARLRAEAGVLPEEINVGGGIPSLSLGRGPLSAGFWLGGRETPEATPADLEAFCRSLARRARALTAEAGWPGTSVLAAEPGRSIVGNAAVLVTRVRGVDGRWVFLDASRNHLAESPLVVSRPIRPLVDGPAGCRRYHLSGSSLNTLDVIDIGRRLPPLEAGAVLAIGDAGAYTVARACRYAGVTPAVYLLRPDGTRRLIRAAEGFADLRAAMRWSNGGE